jgi:hypothetical protein
MSTIAICQARPEFYEDVENDDFQGRVSGAAAEGNEPLVRLRHLN